MPMSLPEHSTAAILARLAAANRTHDLRYPGQTLRRQPVHTVYGGAHLFRAETPRRLGEVALQAMAQHAPDSRAFARALDLPDVFRDILYERVLRKLRSEPVEDYRIDFEDGFGQHSDAEEDTQAVRTAREVVRAQRDGLLPSTIGIRIKPLSESGKVRATRTLDLFISTILTEGGSLPAELTITLPKVMHAEQVQALVALLELMQRIHGLPPGWVAIELMIESPQAILDFEGRLPLPGLLSAAAGLCRGIHFGAYDYSAAADIAGPHQAADHPACEFAKHLIQAAVAGTGACCVDGPTTVLPIGSQQQVHDAWKLSYDRIQQSMRNGFYQGWDLHPAQLPARFAACHAFFLHGFASAAERMARLFPAGKAVPVAVSGNVFDDAATLRGLLNFFLRALNCGAILEHDLFLATGRTAAEIRDSYSLHLGVRQRIPEGP